MNSRQSNIMYNLASSKVPLTSQQLAEWLDVSSRTIKTEMKEIRKILKSVGANLIAKRNEGYSIQVFDQESFLPFVRQLENNVPLNNYSCVDYMPSFLYITRKLIDSSKYIKLDDIADELHSSRSTLRVPIRITADFLSSYKMVTESTPGEPFSV